MGVARSAEVYTHLFDDDHAEAMSALGAMAGPKVKAANVIPLRASRWPRPSRPDKPRRLPADPAHFGHLPGGAATTPGNRIALRAITLPDMAGQNARDAEDQLKSLGLVNVELVSMDPKHNVVLVPSIWKVATTNPPAGATVETSDRVVLNVEDYAD